MSSQCFSFCCVKFLHGFIMVLKWGITIANKALAILSPNPIMLHVASRYNQCEVTDKLLNKAFITPAVLSVSCNHVPYHL